MAVIQPYLEILKVRMEDRLQASIDVPDGLLSAEFPSMMIQSLVENAIKHGLEPKAEGGKLDVKAEIVARQPRRHGRRHGPRLRQGGHRRHRHRPGQHPRAAEAALRRPASMVVADNCPTGTVVTLTVPYQAQAREGATA